MNVQPAAGCPEHPHLRLPRESRWRYVVALTAVAIIVSHIGCGSDHAESVAAHPSLIDESKVIDTDATTLFAMQITVFTYENADARGWPADRKTQEYVRFLQDQGIHVRFLADPRSGLFAAMVNASDAGAVRAGDERAATNGIKKPPMVPDSLQAPPAPGRPEQ